MSGVINRKFFFYLLKKLLIYAIIFFTALTVCFVFVRLIPGNPIQRLLLNLRRKYGGRPDAQKLIEAYIKKFGLDLDIGSQYMKYLHGVFIDFNLGPSTLAFPTPAINLVMMRMPWTIGLCVTAILISWTLGIVIGVFLGYRKNSKIDTVLYTAAMGFSQIPSVLFAVLLLLFFGYMLAWFPTKWAYDPNLTVSLNLDFIASVLYHSFLPGLAFVLTDFIGWFMSTRATTVTILGEDYLLFARAKGLKKIRLLKRYVLRNVLLPQITGLAMTLGGAVNGIFLIEWVFQYPGVGGLLGQASGALDYNTFQAIILISTLSVLAANFVIDIMYPLIDPRIKAGEA
jgi:peptide/nickel transport system permease protein